MPKRGRLCGNVLPEAEGRVKIASGWNQMCSLTDAFSFWKQLKIACGPRSGHCGRRSLANERGAEMHKYFPICCLGVCSPPRKKISCAAATSAPGLGPPHGGRADRRPPGKHARARLPAPTSSRSAVTVSFLDAAYDGVCG